MARLRSVLPLLVGTAVPVALGGCAVGIVGGLAAAGGAGYTAAQERGINGTVDDITLKANVWSALSQANPPLGADLEITVYQGRVLLTGHAPSPQVKAEAQRVATQVAGVRAVYDEVEIGEPENGWQIAQDGWITTRLRSDLVLDPDVRSVNYLIQTSGQSIFLLGSARTQAEIDRVTQVARYVPDVKRVVSYVEVRPGATVAAQPASPASAAPPGNPSAAPTAPVEVQKL
jgi:osmotically-inducible protein OsmY